MMTPMIMFVGCGFSPKEGGWGTDEVTMTMTYDQEFVCEGDDCAETLEETFDLPCTYTLNASPTYNAQ